MLGLMERTDMSMGGWEFVLACAGVIVVVAVMVFVPVRMAKKGGRRRELVLVGAILWGMVMGGSVIYSYIVKLRWEKERAVQVASGYFEPGEASRAGPGWPWGVWAGLMVGYAGICAAAGRRHASMPAK